MNTKKLWTKVATAWLAVLVLGVPSLARAALTLPSTPLGVGQAAKPMTLLVAGRDHKLFYEAYNDASDIDGDGVIDVGFKPSITYFGLFDPDLCYKHTGGSGNGDRFYPAGKAEDGSHKCSAAGLGDAWSGNWLNYATTSRVDALRVVLYGGMREVDSDTETILRRAYIPQDAHSWGKEYASEAENGYKISDYTPLDEPIAGRRHLFGNYTEVRGDNCAALDNCSDQPPWLSVVTNSANAHISDWASTERPVLADGNAGGAPKEYTVRVQTCTSGYHDGCKEYPNGQFKPIGLLHDYGENEAMLFGLLTGSYEKNTSGGVLRKAMSSFKEEVDPDTGRFTSVARIVETFDKLRIRGFDDGTTNNAYTNNKYGGSWPNAWLGTRPMEEGEFPDWGNPIGEMMYEGLRYFAGKSSPTSAFSTSGGVDAEVGLETATWDNPYDPINSAAKAEWCARPNMLVISDINPSYDSDQLPGSAFGSLASDLGDLDVGALADVISADEPEVSGLHFIGEANGVADGLPTAKAVTSLATVRGLAPEEPTKLGSYYSASVAYYGKTHDLNPVQDDQKVDSFFVALASPLPQIRFPAGDGKSVTVVPFAKSVGGCLDISPTNDFQPTNQIVDFYVTKLANMPGSNIDSSINEGRPYARFKINFEDVEQGADHDMDAIVDYEIQLRADGQVEISLASTYAAGCVIQHMGYVISGTTADGAYLVVRDEDTGAGSDVDFGLDYPDVPGALPQAATHQFTPGGSGATLLKDPLWYAAKWGGFVDEDGNDKPNLESEWDADADGNPDTYFLVQNPLKLKQTLARAFDSIIERNASAGNVTSNSTSISTDTKVFQSRFNTARWSGDLWALPISEATGVSETPVWQASQVLPAPDSRNIVISSGGGGVDFLYSNLSSTDQAYLGGEDEVNYLRGARDNEVQNEGTFRDRSASSVLGDIVHSSPFYEKSDDVVYVGANDGMLHAFDAESGVELFAYIPSAAIPQLRNLTLPSYGSSSNPHQYFVDGDIDVSDESLTPGKNYLVATLGLGGKGLFALDVSDPHSFSGGDILWEYFDNTDNDLGFMLGRPVIAKMNNGSLAIIVGNGYNSTSANAVLYVFDLETGSLIKKFDTTVGGDNGMASPGVYDQDGDGKVDLIFAGDLKGNVWKLDVSSSDPADWDFAFITASTPEPLFVATDPAGVAQPITAQITMQLNTQITDANFGKLFLFFGTGAYFRAADPTDTQVQTWYGLIDGDSSIATSRSSGVYADLAERSIEAEAPITVTLPSGTAVTYDARSFAEPNSGDMAGKRGWYLDFDTQSGERMVTSSRYYKLAEPVLVASSIIPVDDACVPGGKGYINAIDPFTGARLALGFFDLNENDDFSDDMLGDSPIGGFDPGIGMPSQPVIIGSRVVVGGSSSATASAPINLGVPPLRGRFMWREIIQE